MDQIWRIRHFLAVTEFGSFQSAARSLNISQPALSKSLRLLEEHLRAPLFDRSTRGVTLTEMGQSFYRRAREIQAQWDGSLIDLNATRDGAQGELRIGVGPTFASVFMPPVLGMIARTYPNLRLQVRTGVGALLIPALQNGEISLYAGGLHARGDRSDEGLDEMFLYDQSNCIVASRENPLAGMGGISAALLREQRWVLLSYDTMARDRVSALLRTEPGGPSVSTITTDSLALAMELVRHDGFLTSLPEPLLQSRANSGLSPLRVPGYDWTIACGVTYRASMRTLAPVRSILSSLRSEVAGLGWQAADGMTGPQTTGPEAAEDILARAPAGTRG